MPSSGKSLDKPQLLGEELPESVAYHVIMTRMLVKCLADRGVDVKCDWNSLYTGQVTILVRPHDITGGYFAIKYDRTYSASDPDLVDNIENDIKGPDQLVILVEP